MVQTYNLTKPTLLSSYTCLKNTIKHGAPNQNNLFNTFLNLIGKQGNRSCY